MDIPSVIGIAIVIAALGVLADYLALRAKLSAYWVMFCVLFVAFLAFEVIQNVIIQVHSR